MEEESQITLATPENNTPAETTNPTTETPATQDQEPDLTERGEIPETTDITYEDFLNPAAYAAKKASNEQVSQETQQKPETETGTEPAQPKEVGDQTQQSQSAIQAKSRADVLNELGIPPNEHHFFRGPTNETFNYI